MKFNQLTIIAALMVLAVGSCKKNDTPPTSRSTKIKSYIEDATNTYYNSIDSFNVACDASDRLISLVSASGKGGFYYTYAASSCTLDIRQGSHLVIREISYINGSQLADSSFQYNDTGDSGTTRLIYNGARHLVQLLNYDYSRATGARLTSKETYSYDASGNMIRQVNSLPPGVVTSTETSTYSTIPADVSLNTFYHPLPYKTLPLTITITSPAGNISSTETRACTPDGSNRVLTETDSDNYGNVVVKKFLYY